MTLIVHVVACDRKHCIGKHNALGWHLPADLQHFKSLTNEGVIVMGRKTFDSLGRLLPKRIHHVITRSGDWHADGVTVAHDLPSAIANAKADAKRLGKDRIFIIGGGDVYAQSQALADILEVTHVDLDIQGDAFYPAIGASFVEVQRSQTMYDETTGTPFYFARYQNSQKSQ